MLGFWLTPAAPGTVAPALLDAVRELHVTVRNWIDSCAAVQSNDQIRTSLPYADLMFAFAFSTLGDHAAANALVEGAQRVLVGPVPEGGSARADEAVTAALVSNFLFRAINYRIGQAATARPHVGTLDRDVCSYLDAIRKTSRQRPANNPHKLAVYVIDRFREQYRVLEPEEQPDPYLHWVRQNDAFQHGRAALWEVYDPVAFRASAHKLLREAVSHEHPDEARFLFLDDALALVGRGGESLALEFLALVPGALAVPPSHSETSPDSLIRRVSLLERAVRLAVRYRHAETVSSATSAFREQMRGQHGGTKFRAFCGGGWALVRALQAFDRREEVERLLAEWQEVVFDGLPVENLQARFGGPPETWGTVLSGLQALAGGWLWVGRRALAEPILAASRRELLAPAPRRLRPAEYTEVARAYIAASDNEPPERGLDSIIELFRGLAPKAVTNTWKTAPYYSRFHLKLVESAVFSACRLGLNGTAAPVAVRPQ